jgi:predicted Fe-S protein YdhL (DUF1289 family)
LAKFSRTGNKSRRARRENRRHGARRARFDSSVRSPCVSVCQIDGAADWCLGCFRTTGEIRDWPIMTAKEKHEVLTRLPARKDMDDGVAANTAPGKNRRTTP